MVICLILIGYGIYNIKKGNESIESVVANKAEEEEVDIDHDVNDEKPTFESHNSIRPPKSPILYLNHTISSEAMPSKRRAKARSLTTNELVESLRQNLVGHNTVFTGPFGKRPIIYCDYIASGRAVAFIEDFINIKVLPFYANTHTMTTITALQTTLFREEARKIISEAVNADQKKHAVIFTGSGSTGAIHKLLGVLRPSLKSKRVVIFNGIMEHHSNLLPWRELSGAEVITIPEDRFGRIDREFLRDSLEEYFEEEENIQLIGCFTAVSNITGVMSDDLAITKLLHQYNALSFWDYAGAGPYVNINIGDKDAIYFSMHKFVGGVQTPGVLVAKRRLFTNHVPDQVGGGTVMLVTHEKQLYVKDIETREEGGTPAIVESIRAGLAMRLKISIGTDYIMKREDLLMSKARARLKQIPNVKLLGSPHLPRLPILSFLIYHEESALYLHHNFVCALLNDLFGIQARGGCACAGPYAQTLLEIDGDLIEQYLEVMTEDHIPMEIMKPGFSRLNLTWFAEDEEIDFVLEALAIVAEVGWTLLPQYKFSMTTAKWTHINADPKGFAEVQELSQAPLGKSSHNKSSAYDKTKISFQQMFIDSENIFSKAKNVARKSSIPDERAMFKNDAADLRWFLLPYEAKKLLCTNEDISDGFPETQFQVHVYDRINTASVRTGTLDGKNKKKAAKKNWHSDFALNKLDEEEENDQERTHDLYYSDDDERQIYRHKHFKRHVPPKSRDSFYSKRYK